MTAHVYPNFTQQMGAHLSGGSNQIDLTGGTVDQLRCGLATNANTYTWNATSQAHATVTNFLAGSGGGAMTEVSTSGTGYSRQALTSVTYSESGLVSTLTCATIQWTATSNWNAYYAFFYDYAAGGSSDATGLLICYWDFGGTVSVVNGGNFTLTINASGLVTWTSS
jgi:hypothetical protein